MPFQSEKQKKFMWAQHPKIARRWTNEGKGYVAGNVPPWMQKDQGNGNQQKDEKKDARRKAIADRLNRHAKKNKKPGKAY